MSTKKKAKPTKRDAVKPGNSQIELEDRRLRFVNEYLANGRNATQAAIASGYAPKAAHVTASRMLKDAKVLQLIEERTKRIAEKVELKPELVMKSLLQALNFDPRKLFDENGNLKSITELDDDTAAALSSIEIVSNDAGGGEVVYTKKIRWESKNAARDQAHKILGAYLADNLQRAGVRSMTDEELEAEIEAEFQRRYSEQQAGGAVGRTEETGRTRTH